MAREEIFKELEDALLSIPGTEKLPPGDYEIEIYGAQNSTSNSFKFRYIRNDPGDEEHNQDWVNGMGHKRAMVALLEKTGVSHTDEIHGVISVLDYHRLAKVLELLKHQVPVSEIRGTLDSLVSRKGFRL